LVRFLLWLSRQKRIQVVISTHSPYVLEELPLEANILLLPGPAGLSVVYGASPEFALSRIDENVHPELVIFVEDRDASTWLREIIAADKRGPSLLSRLFISAVGPANVIKVLGALASQGRLPYKKALAIQDGDQDDAPGCEKMPGTEPPEVVVFNGLKSEGFKGLPHRFGVGAGDLFTHLEDAMLEPDHHRWTAMVGDKVLRSSASVWETLCSQWSKLKQEEESRKKLVDKIADLLA